MSFIKWMTSPFIDTVNGIRKINTYTRIFFSNFITELYLSITSLKGLYKTNFKKALLISIVLIGVLVYLNIFTYRVLTYPLFPRTSGVVHVTTNNTVSNPRGDDNSDIETVFLETFKNTVKLMSPLLDSFVGNTPDVTGFSSDDGKIHLPDGSVFMSVQSFYNKSLVLVVYILTIYALVTGINLIAGTVKKSTADLFNEFFPRFLLFTILITSGTVILSVSIQLINVVDNYFRNGSSLTDYIVNYINAIEANHTTDLWTRIQDVLGINRFDFIAFFKALPVIIPFLAILFVFILVAVQFGLRFVCLYFMAAIAPLVFPFVLSEKTSSIPKNFFKIWLTLLIAQPFFVFAYTIVQAIFQDSLTNSPTFASIFIFALFLCFLSLVGVFVARIFGDVWTSLGQTEIANTINKRISGAVTSGTQSAGRAVSNYMFNKKDNPNKTTGSKDGVGLNTGNTTIIIVNDKGNNNPSGENNPTDGNKTTPPSAFGTKTTYEKDKELKDKTQSMNSRHLDPKAYDIKPNPTNKTLGVSGEFYAKDNKDGISTLYTSQQEALKDGNKLEDLRKVKVDNLGIVDVADRQAKKAYNSAIGLQAKEQNIKTKTHLTDKSSPDWVANSMKIGKQLNTNNNIDGVMVRRVAKNAPRVPKGVEPERQNQIYVYTDKLK